MKFTKTEKIIGGLIAGTALILTILYFARRNKLNRQNAALVGEGINASNNSSSTGLGTEGAQGGNSQPLIDIGNVATGSSYDPTLGHEQGILNYRDDLNGAISEKDHAVVMAQVDVINRSQFANDLPSIQNMIVDYETGGGKANFSDTVPKNLSHPEYLSTIIPKSSALDAAVWNGWVTQYSATPTNSTSSALPSGIIKTVPLVKTDAGQAVIKFIDAIKKWAIPQNKADAQTFQNWLDAWQAAENQQQGSGVQGMLAAMPSIASTMGSQIIAKWTDLPKYTSANGRKLWGDLQTLISYITHNDGSLSYSLLADGIYRIFAGENTILEDMDRGRHTWDINRFLTKAKMPYQVSSDDYNNIMYPNYMAATYNSIGNSSRKRGANIGGTMAGGYPNYNLPNDPNNENQLLYWDVLNQAINTTKSLFTNEQITANAAADVAEKVQKLWHDYKVSFPVVRNQVFAKQLSSANRTQGGAGNNNQVTNQTRGAYYGKIQLS